MKPPGKTSLARMQRTAMLEAERIEISQDGRVRCGMLKEPMPNQVELRDDFIGMVRLIDVIHSDDVLYERVLAALRRTSPIPEVRPLDPDKDVAVDAEAAAS